MEVDKYALFVAPFTLTPTPYHLSRHTSNAESVLCNCDGVLFGYGTRFGSMASQMKTFLDRSSTLFLHARSASGPNVFNVCLGSIYLRLTRQLHAPWHDLCPNWVQVFAQACSSPVGWGCYVTNPARKRRRECNGEIIGENVRHSSVGACTDLIRFVAAAWTPSLA